MTVRLESYDDALHRGAVIALWQQAFGYEAEHNTPTLVIEKKLAVDDDLFIVAIDGDDVIGTVIGGYDGHRGWIYSMAVEPDRRHEGIGSELLREVESRLVTLGCLKVNLQIMPGNEAVRRFYDSLGYTEEPRTSMGKRLRSSD